MENRINYVVARLWYENSNQLCVYAYGSEVHYGTIEDAENFKNFCEKNSKEKYKIYKLVEVG